MSTPYDDPIVMELSRIGDQLVRIEEILRAAFPPADTRPFAERMQEAQAAIMDSLTDEQRKSIGL